MQFVVSLLTAAAVALHLILGCCGHHLCAESTAKRVAEAPVKHSCCGHRHSHSAPIEREAPREAPEDCDQTECSFSASTPEVAAPLIALAAEFVALSPPEDVLAATNGRDLPPRSPLPCRLHLWNGVLLI